ncbi:MAG: 16S rRNA (cytosine(1402)-N(4))-methyltransferase RsmH [Elusimicrobiota bacterium]
MNKKIIHKPVMAEEVMGFLKPEPGNIIVDGTVGEGGHAVLILEKIIPGGLLVGVDRDKDNLKIAEERISEKTDDFRLFCDSYANIENLLKELEIRSIDGILLDLGFSMRHIEASGKGFSFMKDEVLDMRYDTSAGMTASEWINNAPSAEIEKVLKEFGEEKEYRRITAAIMTHRKNKKITTSLELSMIVKNAKRLTHTRIHPATKTFQGIRIFINNELEELRKGLERAVRLLGKGKRMAVLTYHSLEDRIVKAFLADYSGKCVCPKGFPVCRCDASLRSPRVRVLKAMRPGQKEIMANPSARSSHLRGCEVVIQAHA